MTINEGTTTHSWLSEAGKEIEEDTLVKIYECHIEEQRAFLDLHYKNRNYYMTVISALLAIFIGGMLQFHKEILTLILFAIPVTVVVLSELAKRTMDRYYRRFLESVVVLAKIEHILGLDGSLKTPSQLGRILWPKDKQFLPDRWITNRYENESSKLFIKEKMKMGDNRYAHWVFNILEIITIILTLLSFIIFRQVHLS